MDQSKITVRYAKALFALAKEKNQFDRFKTDMELVLSVVQSSPDFILLLESPVVKTSQKAKSIRTIFQDKISGISLRFLEMIVENKREIHIPGICRNFLEFIRSEQGIRTAVVTSSGPLNKETVEQLKSLLENSYKARVEMKEKVNENLLGGFILRVDDQQYDASIATQLRKVKETLLKTEIK
jgi:F-type H+-transporting ATPase subunit delta